MGAAVQCAGCGGGAGRQGAGSAGAVERPAARRFAGIVEAKSVRAGPVLAEHGVVRWRVADLVAWVQGRFGVTLSPQTMSRALRALGYRKLSARPRRQWPRSCRPSTAKQSVIAISAVKSADGFSTLR